MMNLLIFLPMVILVRCQLTHQQQAGYKESLANFTVTTPHCHFNFSYKKKSTGIFSSPNFPNNYPDEVECTYFFQAPPSGRVRISFDLFDLEKPSDKGCRFDYLEIYDIDNDGFKTFSDQHCGSRKPDDYVSLQSKLEIVFKSDFTKSSNGFLAHYYFLGDNYHPFGPSTLSCGPGYITGSGGVVTSPGHPDYFPAMARCTWIIQAKTSQKILLTLTDLEIYSSSVSNCDESSLTVYNGFAIPNMFPEDRYCGELSELSQRRLEFLSTSSRVVIRFEGSSQENERSRGFKIAWTAVDLVPADECDGFLCPGAATCSPDDAKCETHSLKFCIDESLHCNDLPNCGAVDNADEQGCVKTIIWIAVYTSVPVLVIFIVVTIIILCYSHHKRKRLRIIKAEAQMAQQTHWVSPHIRSLESSPTHARTTMHTTSFVSDKHTNGSDLIESKRVTIVDNDKQEVKATSGETPNCNSVANKKKVSNDLKHKVIPCGDEDDRTEITHVHLEPINSIPPNFKSHQKRSSYHLMQELNLEDNVV